MLMLELLRLEGLEVLAPVEGLLDRDETGALVGGLLILGGRWTLDGAEDFAAGVLF